MIPALIGLTFLFAGTAIVLVILAAILRDGRTPFVEPHKGKHVASYPRQGKQPWHTEPMPKLPPEPAPGQDRYPAEEFLDLPVVPGFMRQRGDWGTMPQLEAERLAEAYLP